MSSAIGVLHARLDSLLSRACVGVLGLMLLQAAPAAHASGPAGGHILLPAHLPAQCIATAAADYNLPAALILAIVKHESGGRSVVSRNTNGSEDVGVAQHNTASWVPFLARKYGITRESLLNSPCQSIRALAYVLRAEMNSAECRGVDVWCGVARYHAPYNAAARARYVPLVQAALNRMLATGRFDGFPAQAQRTAQWQPSAASIASNAQAHAAAWARPAAAAVHRVEGFDVQEPQVSGPAGAEQESR